ncbi:ECF transporter S component [Pseudokineococcus basanitobsidens]|uniref:ECF transporter S component n=1 Tax=Pseudokineococcus basanitobsidens TaxID=1926649 RepID=A0ABU8RK56_9ACTN
MSAAASRGTAAGGRVSAVRLRPRSALVLSLASLAGLVMFAWPLLVPAGAALAQGPAASLLFALVLPVLVAVVLAELADGGVDVSALALLGVLSAVNAGLRVLGAGLVGVETVFFLLVLAGRVLGPGFGFVLGCTSLFASALLTAGVGPWLPFQMVAAGWVGLGAGLLPGRRLRGRGEVLLLAGYGVVAAFAFGLLMNLWGWPLATAGTGASYVAGAPLADNLWRLLAYTALTSLGWDAGRAVTTALAVLVVGPAVLGGLRRVVRRASFSVAPSPVTPLPEAPLPEATLPEAPLPEAPPADAGAAAPTAPAPTEAVRGRGYGGGVRGGAGSRRTARWGRRPGTAGPPLDDADDADHAGDA